MPGMRIAMVTAAACALVLTACEEADHPTQPGALSPATTTATIGVNVLLKSAPTAAIVADLNTIGTVLDLIPQLNALTMRASVGDLAVIRAKPYVAAAAMDGKVAAPPEPLALAETDLVDGRSTWNLDAINVTVTPGSTGRNPDLKGLTGRGVYVGVLDSGLLPEWRVTLPAERIDVEHARAFGGGGGEKATVSSQPDKWEKDIEGHGTGVASVITGYRISSGRGNDGPYNGVAPEATIIPVKVLNQNVSGHTSTVAHGVVYIADLKAGPLAAHPVLINMSLGSLEGPDPLETAALDYAISKGVIIVASAGNSGTTGMHYPAAYAPVISVAASGWVHQWEACDGSPVSGTWWRECDIPEPTSASDFFLTNFSSRELAAQQLDLAAPGEEVTGPGWLRGKFGWGDWWGTSFAAPHVTGVAALMAQKTPSLRQAEAEAILKATAIPIPPGSRSVYDFYGINLLGANRYVTLSWGTNATGAGLLDAVAAVKATH
jgi:subtilisin family serine protease